MTQEQVRSFLLMEDWRSDLKAQFVDADGWVTVYRQRSAESETAGQFAALVPKKRAAMALDGYQWDMHIGEGLPTIISSYSGERRVNVYRRIATDHGVEPLTFARRFYGLRPDYLELSEEFRLYHNLWWDAPNGRLVKFNGGGTEHDVARIASDWVRVRLSELKDFIRAKRMCLALFFDVTRFSRQRLDEVGLEEIDHADKTGHHHYTLYGRNEAFSGGLAAFSRLLGKLYLPPGSGRVEGPGLTFSKASTSFIIGTDEDGRPREYTSDPDKLANYFGSNPGAPHYLTPVFFRREVLARYYNQPGKYEVTDGQLHCGSLWGLRLDNDHPKYVIVHLGDLGQYLPDSEHGYWRTFNVVPDGTYSDTTFRRGFLGEWADAERADLAFKAAFAQFSRDWREKFGWDLFRPLPGGDEHLLTALHIPLTDQQAEFDGQVLSLAKILIDSLNDAELARSGIALEPDMRSIAKLAAFLALKSLGRAEQVVKFLRDLYSLRSTGSGHRKGGQYAKVAAAFQLDQLGLVRGFEEILKQATSMLASLSACAPPARPMPS